MVLRMWLGSDRVCKPPATADTAVAHEPWRGQSRWRIRAAFWRMPLARGRVEVRNSRPRRSPSISSRDSDMKRYAGALSAVLVAAAIVAGQENLARLYTHP